MEVTTDKDGIALFSGIRRNTTYDLRETQAPSNYMTAGPWILEVRDEDATLYPATENPDGTLEKASDTDTGTALTVTTGTDSKVLELTIQDTPWGYELSRHRRSRNNLLYRRRPDADLRRGDPVVYPLQASKGG